MTKPLIERFLSKVEKTSKCWLWTASKYRDGYGQISYNGTNARAHRVAWILFRGDIPEGMCVLQSCNNRDCVNPYHLFLADQGRHNNIKTHCPHGHEYTPENTWIRPNDNGKYCKQCKKEHSRKYNDRAKQKRLI